VDSRDFLRKFFKDQLQFKECRSAWCGKCYTSNSDLNFFVKTTPGFQDDRDGDRLQQVWGKRQVSPTAFLEGRDVDHLIIPFECDLCIFWKLKGREPNALGSDQDKRLLVCIRRINLNDFWSRMSSTVSTNKDKVKSGIKLSESVGLEGPYMVTSGFHEWDHCGYEVAIQMVLASLKPGRYSSEYTQWDKIRKLRTAFSNQYRASGKATSVEMALSDDRGQTQRISADPCASVWFGRFFIGCKRRMGQDWRPNKAMSIHLILKLLRRIVYRMDEAKSDQDWERWLTFGAYVSTTYVLSLRGVEGLLVDLKGMLAYKTTGNERYFIVTLLGMVKGENQGRYHLLPSVRTTSSGICIYTWINELVEFKVINKEWLMVRYFQMEREKY
jgi:hypothetical protein